MPPILTAPDATTPSPPQARTVIAELEGNAPRGEYKVSRPQSDIIPAQSQPIRYTRFSASWPAFSTAVRNAA